ncbi:hypothetical protein SAMN02745136_01819 [Anaerocolumna jejuensis DSM 15929]|uniref:Pimeloyl-ACP methyl ester carboxylesterase n=1 Tax=Anaerocolumna jejuensis DSM 15929 TaxID=1121322 RepID=A0A1M6Q0P2_9FIRM|nr:alpha/beta hydrolase [Anaerocolumna jejuensis]SHK13733.1 hypothetical protein SAMN02745136_01819 [Anaerocolumna jejuensis DSM 15929]
MKFITLGNPQNPVALLIHAMFITEKMFDGITSLLQEEYYVILPTLDGHDITEKTTFKSAQEEADKIIAYLQKKHITSIEILLGTSLGGIIAFELFKQNKLAIQTIYLDGTPFIRFSDLRIRMMAKVFKKIAHKSAKQPENPNVLDKLYPVHSLEMKKICGNLSDESINNLARTCYTYELPNTINLTENQSLTFIYSTKEKAKVCIHTVKKFTNCRLIVKDGYKHCEFLYKEPEKYVRMLVKNQDKGAC